MVGTAVNVDKNDGNLNIPEAEASELAATIAELETEGGGGGGATLETGAAWLSAQSVRQKSVGNVEARGPLRPRSGLKANSMLPMKLFLLPLNPLMMEESR